MQAFAYEGQVISGQDGQPPFRPGKPLKFVVEDPGTGNRSSTWRVWTSKTEDDVFVCETESGGEWKTSLHNDWGKWRIAMTAEAAERLGIPRVVLSEQDRKLPAADGWGEGTALLIPCSDLRASPARFSDDVIRVPTSPSHSAVSVRLILQEPGSEMPTKLESAFGLGVLERANGGTLYVVAQIASLSSELITSLAAIRADVRNSAPDAGRYVGILARDDQRILVDLALI